MVASVELAGAAGAVDDAAAHVVNLLWSRRAGVKVKEWVREGPLP
jgi:hypothetical protein